MMTVMGGNELSHPLWTSTTQKKFRSMKFDGLDEVTIDKSSIPDLINFPKRKISLNIYFFHSDFF